MNVKNLARKIVEKGWGYEDWVVNKQQYCGKKLVMRAGKRMSLHFHKLKDENFYVQSGAVEMWWTDRTDHIVLIEQLIKTPEMKLKFLNCTVLVAGDSFYVPIERVHQVVALTDAELFEFSTQHFDSDSYRLIKGD